MDNAPKTIRELRRSLRKCLDNVDKADVPITKTMLWQYVIEARASELVSGGVNYDMIRNTRSDDVSRAFHQGLLNAAGYLGLDGLKKSLAKNASVLDTPEMFFYNTPPVGNVSLDDRVLVTGTNAEVSSLGSSIDEREFSGGYFKNLNPRLLDELRTSPISYCSRVGSFWEGFFGSKDFLDVKVTVPKLVVATGDMRNYNFLGGETLDVRDRLKDIACRFGTKLEMVPSLYRYLSP